VRYSYVLFSTHIFRLSPDQLSRISTATTPPSTHTLQGLDHPDPFPHSLAYTALDDPPLYLTSRSSQRAPVMVATMPLTELLVELGDEVERVAAEV
jgi:hypothetical protein